MANIDNNRLNVESTNLCNSENNNYIDYEIRKYFFDFNLERHQLCKPPNEAFIYFPRDDEIYKKDDKKESNVIRKIFCVKNFTKYEEEVLTKFELYLLNYNELNENRLIVFTDDWERSDTLKFLEATNYDFKKTLQNISDYLDWQKCYFPFKVNDKAIEILALSGLCYGHGRDHCYRPNIFFRMEIYFGNIQKFSFDEWEMALVFFFEYIINNMLISGQIEQWNLFIDMQNVHETQIHEDIYKILKFFQSTYISRLNLAFVFSLSNRQEHLWKSIIGLLDPNIENKIIIIKHENQEEVFNYVNREQIEEKYGGVSKNLYEKISDLEKNIGTILNKNSSNSSMDNSHDELSEIPVFLFFPPIMPSSKFKNYNIKSRSRSTSRSPLLTSSDQANTTNSIQNKNAIKNSSSINSNLNMNSNANIINNKFSSKSNVFTYNPNNYDCIQMSTLTNNQKILNKLFNKSDNSEKESLIEESKPTELLELVEKSPCNISSCLSSSTVSPAKNIRSLNLSQITQNDKHTGKPEEKSRVLALFNSNFYGRDYNSNNNNNNCSHIDKDINQIEKIIEKGITKL